MVVEVERQPHQLVTAFGKAGITIDGRELRRSDILDNEEPGLGKRRPKLAGA